MAAVYIMMGGLVGGIAGLFSLATGASPGMALGQYMLLGHLTILAIATYLWAAPGFGDSDRPFY